MKRRTTKARKAAAKSVSAATAQNDLAQVLDAALVVAIAKQRRQQEAEHQREQRQLWKLIKAERRKLPKRDLSQLKFAEQHWWGDGTIFKRHMKADGSIGRDMEIEEAKAALIYEALRRRAEVQQAWLERKWDKRAKGFQEFVSMAIPYLHKSWNQLDEMTQQTLVNWTQSPWFVPPLGYFTFPEKSSPKRCEDAVLQKIPRLGERHSPVEAQNFIKYLKRFEDAGFIFVAIDHKNSQRDKYALNALQKLLANLPLTARRQDLITTIEHHLPPDISAEDRQALEEKERQGILTGQDFNELWRKYPKLTTNLSAPWHKTATYHEQITGKRKRKIKRGDILVDEMRFDFLKLFGELANLDSGKIQQSDFVARLRLG